MSTFPRSRPVLVLALLWAAPLAAQAPGEVLWHQKIGAAQGNGPRNLKVNDQFGRAAAALGDVDGDGVCDIAVGALGDDDGVADDSLQYGACWILFMKPDGSVKDHYKIGKTSGGLPLDPGDEWGRAVRELGDWNLDGIPDVMVGTCYDDDNGTDKGAFYLLFLNRDGSVKEWKKVSELAGGFTGDLDPDDQFGRGIRVLGDLDLDGVPEIGVGSIRDDDGGRNRGAYWILFMRRDGTVKSYTKLSETAGNFQSTLSDYGEFGFDACVLGDRNGDGIQDIAICAPDQKTDGSQQGAVFIVYLNRNGTSKSDFRIAENYSGFLGNPLDYNDEFGCCIDMLGDVDRDGIADLAVGAGKDDDGPTGSFDRGAVYVLFLNANATVKSFQKLSRLNGRFYGAIDNADRFGTSLACPGDLNGDGIPDVFSGVRFDDDGGSGVGCEYFLALNDGTLVPPIAKFLYTPKRGKAPQGVVHGPVDRQRHCLAVGVRRRHHEQRAQSAARVHHDRSDERDADRARACRQPPASAQQHHQGRSSGGSAGGIPGCSALRHGSARRPVHEHLRRTRAFGRLGLRRRRDEHRARSRARLHERRPLHGRAHGRQ
jgi:hypothetical protein